MTTSIALLANISIFLFSIFFTGLMPAVLVENKDNLINYQADIFSDLSLRKTSTNGHVLGAAEIASTENKIDSSTKDRQLIADSLLANDPMPLLANPEDDYPSPALAEQQEQPVDRKQPAPDLSAQSALAYDCDGDQSLYDKDGDKVWPIASITKLLTALVFVEHNPGWNEVYQLKSTDRREGGRIYLFTGEKATIKDLFYTSLVASDNTATAAMVNSTSLTEEEFVRLMNQKARQIGLTKTKFIDPVGLNNNNQSTAKEVAIFARAALANDDIRQATLTRKYQFKTQEGREKEVYNTDDLLNRLPENGVKILGGKTGYLEAAGYCFVGQFTNHQGKKIVTVVLGSESDQARFEQTEKLADWVYQNFVW